MASLNVLCRESHTGCVILVIPTQVEGSLDYARDDVVEWMNAVDKMGRRGTLSHDRDRVGSKGVEE